MIIANEGKKNMEVRANFEEPNGCGCVTSLGNKASVRDAVCTCGCGGTSVRVSARTGGRDATA